MKIRLKNNQEVAHVFAQRIQEKGEASNFFFKGDTIYSYGYHFPIAKYVSHPESGRTVVLFTKKSYSNSTAKHINYTRSALSHYDLYYTWDINSISGSLKRFEECVKHNLLKLSKARKKEIYIEAIQDIYNEVTELLELYPKFKIYKKDFPLLYQLQKDSSAFFSENAINLIKKQQQAKKNAQLRAFKKQLSLWRAFDMEASRYINHPTMQNVAFLRYHKETNQIQTSKGVNLPLDRFKQLLIIWKRDPKKLEGEKIQYYTINKADDKMVVAGCHTITSEEATKICKTLKICK